MNKLLKVIRFSVRILAVIMTIVILWGVLDVAWVILSTSDRAAFYVIDHQ